MKVTELDLPPGVAEILRQDGIETLYPPQEKAIPLALQGRNLFLAVPTASGKSLVAYLAALKHVLERGGKVLYIVPLRALAAEKYEDLKRFEPLGVRTGVSVGDFDSPDPALEKFDIIVATSEKADSLLRHRSSWLQKISLVVADEVHLIHDPERGPTLEITLTKFRKFNPELQIIALSATVKNSKQLAEWLEAEHISSEWRPTPLKEGVYLDGGVRFTDNSKLELEDMRDPIWSLAKDSIKGGGQCLVFVNTRRSTETVAAGLATRMREIIHEKVKIEDEESLLVDEGEPTSIGKRLRSCVHRGVAFHHAGLTNEQRRSVEQAFKKGTIKVIVATPTLAAGINLPARRVIIREVHRYENGVGNVSIPVLEIKQMCGRAGRPRYDKFGEAILIAKSEAESDFLFENYLLGETEEIYSKLGSEGVLRSHVLATIATNTVNSKEGLMDFLDSTFYAHQTSLVGLEDATENVLEFLEKEGMLLDDGQLRATFYGKRVSDLYIDPLTAVKLRDALRTFDLTKDGEFGFLHAISSTPDMLPLYLRRTDNDWLETRLNQCAAELLLPVPTDLEEYEFFLAEVKTACVIDDWQQELEEESLLEKYTIGPGDLHNKVEIGEWLLYSMRELSNIFNREAYPPLTELMIRVRYGVRRELLELVKLRGVGRARARSMYDNGVRVLEDVRELELGKLARIPKIGDVLARSLKEQVGDNHRSKKKFEVETKPAETQTDSIFEKDAKSKSGQRKLLDF